MHTQDNQLFSKAHCFGDYIGIFPHGVGKGRGEFLGRIEEYSRRFLAKDSGILNGIMGIFRVFAESPLELDHVHGIPLLLAPGVSLRSRDGNMDWYACEALLK